MTGWGGLVSGGVGWVEDVHIFFLTNLAMDAFLFCVFFFLLFVEFMSWLTNFIFFCNLRIFLFFPFTVRMGNFCVSHFVRFFH